MAQFLTDTQINSVYELYIGYFNRAPEAGGLNYWSNYYLAQVNAGKTDAAIQKEIANKFYDAAVQYNIYTAGTPVADFIKASYLNALGRTSVDDAGMTYWTAKLTSSEVTRGEFVQKLISDAKGFASDATYGWVSKYLDNRMAVAKAFAAANTTTGDAAITAGKAALSAVTPAAVQAGQTTAQALAAAAGFTSVAGNTFTLTAGAPFDNFASNSAVAASKTTAGDDLFRAVVNNSLETNDAIDAGAGNDTLKANVSATGTANAGSTVPAAVTTAIQPLLKDLENVFINATVTGGAGSATASGASGVGGAANVVFDATDSTGLKAVWSEASTVAAGAAGASGAGGAATLTFQNLKLGTEVGVKDTTSGATFAFAGATGAADAATLNLADASGGAAVTIAAIENLTIKSSAGDLAAVSANNAAVTAAQAETVTITGSQALTLTLTGANVATINSSAFEKALTLNFTTTAATPVTIKGGVGADTFNINDVANGGKVTIDLGAGNDTLNIRDSAFHAITTGEGKDTINLTNGVAGGVHKALDVSTAAKLEASAIVITDFVSGSDVLNVNSTAGGAEINLTGTQLATIATGSANLLAAANAALAAAAATKGGALVAGDGTVFQYGDSTYVVIDEVIGTANTIEAGDTIIKLTGVTSVIAADITIS